MNQKQLLRAVLTKLDMIETKLNYLHEYVQQKEGELNPTCKTPLPRPIIETVEQYVCRLNHVKEKNDDDRPIAYD